MTIVGCVCIVEPVIREHHGKKMDIIAEQIYYAIDYLERCNFRTRVVLLEFDKNIAPVYKKLPDSPITYAEELAAGRDAQ